MSFVLMMPPNHLILCHPLPLFLQSFPAAGSGNHWSALMIAVRNINNLRYADDTTLMAESEEPLDESESGE